MYREIARANPERLVWIASDPADRFTRQPDTDVERDPAIAIAPDQGAILCASPRRPLRTFAERSDGFKWRAFFRLFHGKGARLHPVQSAATRADPHVTLPVFQQTRN